MTLINCPECSHQVSSDAPTCPDCGFSVRDHLAGKDEKGNEETKKSKGSSSDEGTYSDRPFSFRCGRAFTLIRTGKWHAAVVLLEVKAWLGRYVGFVLGLTGAVVAVPAVIGVPLPLPTVWKVFLFVSVAAIVLMPLSIVFAHWLLKRVGFALRARHFPTGLGEGLVLAVVFAAMYAVSQYAQGVGKPDAILSPPTSATNEPSVPSGSGTQVEPIKPIREILAERKKDGPIDESWRRNLPPPSVELTVAPAADDTRDSQQEGDGDFANPVSADERVRVLQRFLGEWEMTLKNNGQRIKIGKATVVQIPSEPRVLWRISGNDGSLRAIELAWYDRDSDAYVRWQTADGSLSDYLFGEWNDTKEVMTWKSLVAIENGQTLVESVSDDLICTQMTVSGDGVVTRRLEYELRRVARDVDSSGNPPPSRGHRLLDQYVGVWEYSSTFSVAGNDPIENNGRCVSARLAGEPVVLEQVLNRDGGLADIRVLSALNGDKRLRRRSFNNAGVPYDMRGLWDAENSTMTWMATLPNGESMTTVDLFTEQGRYVSKLTFLDPARRQTASATKNYRQLGIDPQSRPERAR